MKKILTFVMTFMVLTLAFNIQQAESLEPPATEWTRTYGGASKEHSWSVIQTSDGGYAMAGFTDSFGAGDRDIWLVKVGPKPRLILTPDTGFSCATVVGFGFSLNTAVAITWDGTAIPTVPSSLTTNEYGNFSALISVPTQNDTGSHTVKAIDEWGNEANATYTVIDMTGPQGPQGLKGDKGDVGPQGPQSPLGETRELSLIVDTFTIAASIIAICLATIALLKKKT